MDPREELQALRRLAELEAKADGQAAAPSSLPDRPALPSGEDLMRERRQAVANQVGGLVRGAGSIGATLLSPFDMASDALAGRGLSLESNRQRRSDMDAALQSMIGADPQSGAYQGMKTVSEIGGTMGVGGVLAKGAQAVRAAPQVVSALQSAGFTTGAAPATVGAKAADLALRTAAGGVVGGASAGLVNPDDAATGAKVGAMLPGALKIAGAGGRAVGNALRGPEQTPDLVNAINAAREAGYVIPPTQARPTLGNRLMEGLSGKITTQQNASARNAAVTAELVAKDLGLPAGEPISVAALDKLRAEAGKAYEAVASLPSRPAARASSVMNTPEVPGVNPREMVFDLRKARNDATAWFRSYGRTADPDALVKAKNAAATATKLEQELEQYAASLGRDDLVPAMREARQLIAKTYTAEGALNAATGSIDAKKLAGQLQKGKPISGGMKQAAEFASRFPKAAQTVESMGSLPQVSPLDFSLGALLSVGSMSPLGMLATATRPVARAATLSPLVQNRLVQGPGLNALMLPDEAMQALYRAAPVAISGRNSP